MAEFFYFVGLCFIFLYGVGFAIAIFDLQKWHLMVFSGVCGMFCGVAALVCELFL